MAGSGVHKRSKTERELDLTVVAELYLKGRYQQKIAEHLGDIRPYTLTQQQISQDLKTIRKRWLESSIRDFDELKAQDLAKIDQLEVTYWESWERSLGTEQNQNGDPRFLVGVQWCINKRCDIFGLDAPTKVAPTDPSGRKAYVLTESERMERLTTLLGHALAGLEEEPNEAISPPDDA